MQIESLIPLRDEPEVEKKKGDAYRLGNCILLSEQLYQEIQLVKFKDGVFSGFDRKKIPITYLKICLYISTKKAFLYFLSHGGACRASKTSKCQKPPHERDNRPTKKHHLGNEHNATDERTS